VYPEGPHIGGEPTLTLTVTWAFAMLAKDNNRPVTTIFSVFMGNIFSNYFL
jgi:hypothetical protein